VGQDGGQAAAVLAQQLQRTLALAVRAADVEQRQLFAAHGVQIQGRARLGRDSGHHQPATAPGHLDALAERCPAGGAIYGRIHSAAAVSARIWRTGSISRGIESGIGAQPASQAAALSHRLDRPDPSGARQLQGEDGQQPDRAGAETAAVSPG